MLTVPNVFVPEFDAKAHRYRSPSGFVLPSVTQILKPVTNAMYKNVDPGILNIKADLGTAVHSAIEFLIDDDLDEGSLDLSVRPYVNAWKRWRDYYKPKFLLRELRLGCDYFCGTVDCVCEIKGETFVIDWKTTSKLHRTVGPQMSAYEMLVRKHMGTPKLMSRMAVRLGSNGGYECMKCTDPKDYQIFEYLLKLNEWMRNNE